MTNGGPRLAAFVEQELKAERDRRAAVDARGQSVVTTSASLVTLFVAVGAFITSQDKFEFPRVALWPLGATLAAFGIATCLAILATFNLAYRVADGATLSAIPHHLTDSEEDTNTNIVTTNVLTVRTMRSGTNKKTWLLFSALCAQLAALISLAVTIFLVILNA